MSDFDLDDWFFTTWDSVGDVALTALGVYAVLVLYTRVSGLRTFSKMSGFDFAMTVAIGSIVAGSILFDGPSLLRAVAALTAVFVIQMAVAALRQRLNWMENLMDNEPIVLMTREGMISENLRRTHVTEADVWAKLREANVTQIAQVRAVVMETTGDISVLHGDPDGPGLEACLLTDVRDADRVATV
ncbi:DUF421 domain-containing protein [Rubricoccus marinus]|uniref:YetF C-terminal domain-containing protein n=1 Tax=Rubricoccus marinus TaxID=716817 RepID=A0A259TVH8_9BACT|nr:YetF domain-containing protein [Rubricoccus marinus]OZC01706.1 hypothetical protein BSZ36_01130 [Rubricoccus marinus]